MKMTKLAILAALILFPFFVVHEFRVVDQKHVLTTKMRYDAAIHAAVDDAAQSLILNSEQAQESRYDSLKRVKLNRVEGIRSFYRTLYTNFDVTEDANGQSLLDIYIPVIAMIGYDGYYIYADEEFKNEQGETEIRHVWSIKKPYAYQDNAGNTIAFTLDNYVIAYDQINRTWVKGFQREIGESTSISLLQPNAMFEQVRRQSIVHLIQEDLRYYLQKHNTYAKQLGITYTFTLPTISQEAWNNTIDDVGVIAFVQGIPIGDQHYNNYALGGARLVKASTYRGIQANGVKYYYRERDCASTLPTIETFLSEKEAALQGYYPLSCQR
ncbi:hypothetical protein BVG16_23100 [Paenibacillus selenitireducens]|uniref:F0F1-type ATP synthase n=1 Tax=Paenibacillus selenitireducens TaxID=1324314 RepID=A0A1T2X453_9BACL|nr:hypothetical protein [Paenibacillus selenitireducens]OPA74649.1 hypothetical protein BVG16_23100 [Paenibacillus selenitireducens]